MKKYFALATFLFAIACNSNDDKKADEKMEEKVVIVDNLTKEDTTAGSGLLSGKFEIIDVKKENLKTSLPKTFVKFTRNGEYLTNNGASFFYKIDGDNFTIMASDKLIISKSKIEFLNAEKTSFIIKNTFDKSEVTYKKVN